ALLAAEKADALAAISAARLAEERADAMDYYLGDMRKDMPAQDGRSRAVSTDAADTIEGLMPNLMDIFAGSDEVVRFEPVGPEDEAAAQQETDYVNHVFMQQNPGFMILYSFIKDALLSKVGIVKVWWEEREEESRETYYDLTDDQFALLAQAVMEYSVARLVLPLISSGRLRVQPFTAPERGFNGLGYRRDGNGKMELASTTAGLLGLIILFVALFSFGLLMRAVL